MWLETNSIPFKHALKYQNKIEEFLTGSGEAIEVLHDHIWMVVIKVMENTGKPVADGLGIAMHLIEMLPIILLHLAFHSAMPGLTGFMPEVYAAWPWTDILDFSHVPPPQSDRRVLNVLCDEIVKNVHGITKKDEEVEPTWMMTMADVSTIGAKAVKDGAGDGPTSSQCMSHTPD